MDLNLVPSKIHESYIFFSFYIDILPLITRELRRGNKFNRKLPVQNTIDRVNFKKIAKTRLIYKNKILKMLETGKPN